jgi:allophanate hydrolase
VSIFAPTVALAARVLHAAMGHDCADPYSRRLRLEGSPYPQRFRFGVPDELVFFGDELARAAFADAVARLRELGGTPVTIDYRPLREAASLLYDSALVAERYAAVRAFFDGHADEVVEPVRGILASGSGYAAWELCEAQTRLRALAQRADAMWEHIDLLVVPTAPTHYTIAQMHADPVALNRNLGAYTNFVNLLDYAALSVPSTLRADGLPFGITLIGRCGSDLQLAGAGPALPPRHGAAAGGHRPAAARARCHPGPGRPRHREARRGRRASLGHGAEPAAHRARRPLAGTHRDRARLPPVRPARHHAAETGAAAHRPRHGPPHRRRGVGDADGAVRFLRRAGAAALGDRHAAPGRRRAVQGFVCEAFSILDARDISHFGGWRAYLASQRSDAVPAF